MTVAPAMAWSELGGIGTQRSSQISIPTRTEPGLEQPLGLASKRRSVAEGDPHALELDFGRLGSICRLEPAVLVVFLVMWASAAWVRFQGSLRLDSTTAQLYRPLPTGMGAPTTTNCGRPVVARAIWRMALRAGLQEH